MVNVTPVTPVAVKREGSVAEFTGLVSKQRNQDASPHWHTLQGRA